MGVSPEKNDEVAVAAVAASVVGRRCVGCVYGCAIGNIVNYCAHKGASVPAMVRKIHQSLVPVAAAVLSESGSDANTLCSGIAAHRIARAQQLRMGQLEKNIHCRHANPAIVVGLTASIYVVYAILAAPNITACTTSRASDIRWFVKHQLILQSLHVAEYILKSSKPPRHGPGCAPEFEIGAVEAEFRAIQRAIQGVKTANIMATQNDLDEQNTFSVQLSFYAKAAWPTNERIGADTHDALLARIATRPFFTGPSQQASHAPPHAPHPGLVVPLSQMSGIGGGREMAAYTDSSSATTGSPHNPASSGGSSVADSDLDIPPFMGLGLNDSHMLDLYSLVIIGGFLNQEFSKKQTPDGPVQNEVDEFCVAENYRILEFVVVAWPRWPAALEMKVHVKANRNDLIWK